MKINKSVSVIIPVFNRKNTLSRAINSVLSQTVSVQKIILIDDGSTDSTAEICKKYSSDIDYYYQENTGVSGARNFGISKATTEWIALLDSDDEWLPEKMEKQWDYLELNPHIQILQSEEIWIRNGKRVNPMKKHKKISGNIFKESLSMCIVSPSAVLFKKSLFEELGKFDVELPVCEDYDLWLRASLKYPIGLVESCGIKKYGGHEDQLSRKYWGMDRFRVKSMEKVLLHPDITRKQKEYVIDEMKKMLYIITNGAKKRQRNEPYFEKLLNKLER